MGIAPLHRAEHPRGSLPSEGATPKWTWKKAQNHGQRGSISRRVRAVRYFGGEYTRNVLIFTPSRNGPEGGQTLWPPNLYKRPTLPTHKHGTIKSTIQLASISSYLKWPLARCDPSRSQFSTSAEVPGARRQIQRTTQHRSPERHQTGAPRQGLRHSAGPTTLRGTAEGHKTMHQPFYWRPLTPD